MLGALYVFIVVMIGMRRYQHAIHRVVSSPMSCNLILECQLQAYQTCSPL